MADEWESGGLPNGDIADGYGEYVYAAASDVAGLYRIENNVFVVQGWDSKAMCTTVCTMNHCSIL